MEKGNYRLVLETSHKRMVEFRDTLEEIQSKHAIEVAQKEEARREAAA